MLRLIPLCALLFAGCAGYDVKIGAAWKMTDGSELGASVDVTRLRDAKTVVLPHFVK